jgi:GT2 family glycosyltransferase
MSFDRRETRIQNYPKVSVIIPNWNGLKLLKITVPALLKTRYPDIEVIVVDNGSSDDSVSYLSNVSPKVSVISLKENKGMVIAYNLGVSAARGSLVSFLNNDMEVNEDWLLPLVLAMERDERLAACDSKYINYYERDKIDSNGGAGRFIDKYGNAKHRGVGEIDKGQFNIQEEAFYALSLFKKDLLVKVGGFDESFFGYYDETDLCWRLRRFGYKILYVPESVIYHMGSATSRSNYDTSKKNPKKKFKKTMVFHFCKNRLRMLIKNQFGISLIFSVLICLFDFFGNGIVWLLTGNQDYALSLGKALIWNLKDLKGTLQNRIRFKNESNDFNALFLPYSGVWRTRGAML